MRVHWLLLSLIVLIGCGQPLQINRPQTQVTAGPTLTIPGSTNGAVHSTEVATFTPSQAVETTPATLGGTEVPVSSAPTTPSIVIVPRTAVPVDSLQHWRAQQLDRVAFPEPRNYVASQPAPLLWFDPVNGQTIEIGTIISSFPAQAQFTLRTTNQPALEVLYRINGDFGLTAISEAVRERMRAAKLGEQVEAYVVLSEAITIQQ